MTATASTVSTVRTWLYGQITGLAALTTQPSPINPTNVVYGPRGRYDPEENIEVGMRVVQDEHPHAFEGNMTTAGTLWESYTISVDIEVLRAGDDELSTFNRCKTLVDAIDNAVRTDPTAGGNVLVSWPARHMYDSVWAKDGKGRVVVCVAEYHFETAI